ncbi:MAG: hypothetical protein HYZ91_06300 [Candidatus Omnitrophica bacterium]|nr:hypothetical protein [Candidatus Omnitrophota bacterium]
MLTFRNPEDDYPSKPSQKTEYMQLPVADDIQQTIRAIPGKKWKQIVVHHAVQEHVAIRPREGGCKKERNSGATLLFLAHAE